MLLTFANDTKLDEIVNTLKDRNKIQNDLDRLENWAENSGMKFNREQILHCVGGGGDKIHKYKMGYTWLGNTTCGNGLDVDTYHIPLSYHFHSVISCLV